MITPKLSVNLNKFALLRNSRGAQEPSITAAAQTVLAAGAAGITLHPRPDCRHATYEDAMALRKLTRAQKCELNLEGNPLAAPRSGYPGFLKIVQAAQPDQVTLVPDEANQLTSDHGWNIATQREVLAKVFKQLAAMRATGARFRISLFMDAESKEFELAYALGAQRIELYTYAYAKHYGTQTGTAALTRYVRAAAAAAAAGLAVNAGHDLKLSNLRTLVQALPQLVEVSIGHALVCDALNMGLAAAVQAYVAQLQPPAQPR